MVVGEKRGGVDRLGRGVDSVSDATTMLRGRLDLFLRLGKSFYNSLELGGGDLG